MSLIQVLGSQPLLRIKTTTSKVQPQVVERIQEQLVETIEVLPQERVQLHTAPQIVHEPVPQIQEQSAVTGLVNSQFPITAVEASQVVDSCSLSEEFAAPTEVTTLKTSSTSTSSSSTSTISDRRLDEFASMLNSCIELLTPETASTRRLKGLRRLPRRMPEPPVVESDRTFAKRRRRTRYTPLPGIMENAVYLAPSAWPPSRRA